MTGAASAAQFQWGAFQAENGPASRRTLMKEAGLKEREISERSVENLEVDKMHIERFLWQYRALKVGGIDGNRSSMQTYDGRPLKPEANAIYLEEEGERRQDNYLRSYIDATPYKFPKPIPMVDGEVVKGKESVDINLEDEQDEEALRDNDETSPADA
jgi:hypothetical protein